MTRAVAGIAALALCLAAAPAMAQRVVDARIEDEASDVVVRIDTTLPAGAADVHFAPGAVVVRLSDAHENVFIDRAGAAGLRGVSVRPGSARSTVVRIRLPDGRTLRNGEASLVHETPTRIALRIAHTALPAAHAEDDETPRPAHENEPAPGNDHHDAPSPMNAATHASAASPTTATAPATAPASAETTPTRTPLPPLHLGHAFASPLPSSSGPNMPVLALITVLLGGAFLFAKWMSSRKGAAKKAAAIDVVASRKLGPKHQLVVVRAFGKEHLLSVQGQQTVCISSRRSELEGAATAPRTAERDVEQPERDAEPMPRITQRRLAMPAVTPELLQTPELPAAGFLRLVTERGVEIPPAKRARPASVEGLLRLRAGAAR